MRLFLSMISLCFLLTSCEVFNSSSNNGEIELIGATEKWNAKNSQHYTFKNSRRCECPPPYEYTVEVVNGEIKDIYYEKLGHISYERKDMTINTTHTIAELFDLLEKYEKTAYYYEVEFHEELGYPTKINIDPSKNIADEEIFLEISNYSSLNK